VKQVDCIELSQRLELQAEYHLITGLDLPKHIRQLPTEKLREAVRQAREDGGIFGELKPPVPEQQPSSLTDWDRQDFKNGNAYGGQ